MAFSKEVRNNIEQALNEEYKAACEKHGKTYNSFEKSYDVLFQEIVEAGKDSDIIKKQLETFFFAEREKNTGRMKIILSVIFSRAMDLACEAIQIAAVARKSLNTIIVKENYNKEEK